MIDAAIGIPLRDGLAMRILFYFGILLLWGCNQPLERTPLLNPDTSSPYHTVNPYVPGTQLSLAQCSQDANCRYAFLSTGLPR